MTSPIHSVQVEKGVDYSGQDLRKNNLSNRVYDKCNFDRANMAGTEAVNSKFINCTFRDTICTNTNFKDTSLGSSVFSPADCYGMTISVRCSTFQNVSVNQSWFFCFMMMAAMMRPLPGPVKEDLHAKLIEFIGAVRYTKLRALFDRRSY